MDQKDKVPQTSRKNKCANNLKSRKRKLPPTEFITSGKQTIVLYHFCSKVHKKFSPHSFIIVK